MTPSERLDLAQKQVALIEAATGMPNGDRTLTRARYIADRAASGHYDLEAANRDLGTLLRRTESMRKRIDRDVREATERPRVVWTAPIVSERRRSKTKPGDAQRAAARKAAKAEADRALRSNMRGAGGGNKDEGGNGTSRKSRQKRAKRQKAGC